MAASGSPRRIANGKYASLAVSLMLALIANHYAFAIDEGVHGRFFVPATGNNIKNDLDLRHRPRHRRHLEAKAYEKAHHGGGRGHHRDPLPVDGSKSGKTVVASNMTSLAAVAAEAVAVYGYVAAKSEKQNPALAMTAAVSELEAVTYGVAKAEKEVGSGKADKKVRQGAMSLPLPPPVSTLPEESLVVTTVSDEYEAYEAKAGKSEGVDNYHPTTSLSTTHSDSYAKSGKTELGGGGFVNVTLDGDNLGMFNLGSKSNKGVTHEMSIGSKTSKGVSDTDMLKPKSSKVQGPLSEYFVKEPTSHLDAKSGKAGDMYAPDGKSSKAMSFDSSQAGSKSLLDTIATDPNFSKLYDAINAADLADVLKVPGPLTLVGMYTISSIRVCAFLYSSLSNPQSCILKLVKLVAPTNEAFDALPEGFLDTLLVPENLSLLQDAIGYHAFPGFFPSDSMASGVIPTLSGATVSVVVSDSGITINGANVIIPDIVASNGIIHGIDALLIPPEEASATGPAPAPPAGGGAAGSEMTSLPPQPLLTLSPTLSLVTTSKPPVAAFKAIEAVAGSPEIQMPTYSPTGFVEALLSTEGGNVVALEPFGLRLLTENADSINDEDTVTRITEEHLIHSFRTQGYDVEGLKLMILEPNDRRILLVAGASVRRLEQAYELIYGGVMHFPTGVTDVPSAKDATKTVQESFSGERSTYYVQLLRESGVDVSKASLDMNLVPDASRFKLNLFIGLLASLVGILLVFVVVRAIYKRRQLSIDNLDLGKGKSENMTIRLQYTNDEIDGYPATVAETMMTSRDQLSVPRLIKGIEDEINFITTPGEMSKGKGNGKSKNVGEVSPLESPKGNSDNASQSSSPRYISVFTVKKDCGGKTLDQINLRELVIAYLSRMMKKLPNTHLLPYDKKSSLPTIINIRNIPDDIVDLQHYVGNPHVDEKTGKVMFNLRVEGDEPVSKMKNNATGHDKLSLTSQSKSTKKNSITPISDNKTPQSPGESQSSSSIGDVTSLKSPITPASLQDVDL